MGYSLLFAADLVLAVAVAAGAAAAAYAAVADGPLRRYVRPLLAVACALLAGRVAVAVALAGYGWEFASRRAAYELPLTALGLFAALVAAGRPGQARVPATGVAAGVAALAAVDVLVLPGVLVAAALTAIVVVAPLAVWLTGRDGGRVPGLVGLAVVGLLVVPVAVAAVSAWRQSRPPGTYDMADLAAVDNGGATTAHAGDAGHADHADPHAGQAGDTMARVVSVADLTGRPSGRPTVRYTLTASPVTVRDAGGKVRPALAFNGQVPGPRLAAHVGDLVEVTLRNNGVRDGVSVHWHGYDVPNAEDGVAGVTQDAVGPGGSHVYRFRAEQAGTYWYHSHQSSAVEVDRGLYGALVVDGPSAPAGEDLTVVDHPWRPSGGFLTGAAFDPASRVERRPVATGTAVRLRLVNTGNAPRRYRLLGTSFRLAAVDGTDVHGPALVRDRSLLLAAGGRYDLTFRMPPGPVTLTGLGDGVRLVLGSGPPASAGGSHGSDLDLLDYGSAAVTPFGAGSRFDRDFRLVMDRRLAFRDGRLGYQWTVNGLPFPRMPMLMVAEGDLVRMTFVNRTTADHPMHLHGHHMLVLARNGREATGSPWWTDTLNVAPGETYTVAFRADNPGVWMDHCHDLRHAAAGFVMHLAYQGVTTPFRVGADTPNRPE